MTQKFLNTETNNSVEYKEDNTETNNSFYNTKIEQIRMVFRQYGWIIEQHQPFYGQPDMVRNVRAWLEKPLKGSLMSNGYECDLPCVLSINYDQIGPDCFSADYWIQTANSDGFGNDVRIHQRNATNGSTNLVQSVTEQMKNNFHWFLINTNR
tara:strand:- start:9 stop:467 length:459 start_codon:yes stop_codon:yes gene_type:complete